LEAFVFEKLSYSFFDNCETQKSFNRAPYGFLDDLLICRENVAPNKTN